LQENGSINNMGAKVPESKSSLEHSLPGAKVTWSKSSGEERKFHLAKVPGS